MALVHELSWSVSRDGMLSECARRYYLTYYLAWKGWEWRAPEERKKAYALKKLERLPMWSGSALHLAIADWFARRAKGADGTSKEDVAARAVALLRAGYDASVKREREWSRDALRLTGGLLPKKPFVLAEHYYGESVVDHASGEAARYGGKYLERIERSVATFFEAPELAQARASDPTSWLACEELGTIELFGTKVYAVPDFALRDGDGVVILDWKTGRPRERDRFQLALYALYAEQTWGADPTAVRCADAYLDDGSFEEVTFERAELDGVLGTIESSMARMRELHFDADRSSGDADAFPQLETGSRTCERCNFREVCLG